MSHRWCVPVALAGLLAGGCSSFDETHYFRDGANPRNYYRLRVSGNAALASSRYVSGYFDETAIDTYFGEFTQPEKGRFLPCTQPAGGDGGSEVRALAGGKSLEDRKLLLLFTTNSDEIATGIQSLAQSEAVATTLSGILNRDRITGSRDAAFELKTAKARAKMIGDRGAQLILGIPDPPPQAETEQNLLAYANVLVRYLGGTGGFADLNAAAKWLEDNRARLEARLLEE